jgi:hypothetical protein
MVIIEAGGVRVSMRREIAELTRVLMEATERRFKYDIKSGQTWGNACRQIRGLDKPSFHSWGLAIDTNSLSNPMSATFRSDMPPEMVHMWEACGWFWGGRYRGRTDSMHYEYIGRPADVAAHLKKARAYLNGTAEDDMSGEDVRNILHELSEIQGLLKAPNLEYKLGDKTKKTSLRSLVALNRQALSTLAARQRTLDAKVDKLIVALAATDTNLESKLRAALADATIKVNVAVAQGAEEDDDETP